MKVTVLGPNGINDATFHVHRARCQDIKKPKYQWARADGVWHVDVESKQELMETLFGDFIGTGETQRADGSLTTWEDYLGESKIYPCVSGIS